MTTEKDFLFSSSRLMAAGLSRYISNSITEYFVFSSLLLI